MIRVGDLDILCPICGKPDWCMVADDGTAAICSRIAQNSVKKCGNAGWLHILQPGQFHPKQLQVKRKPPIDWLSLNKLYIDKLKKSVQFLEIGIEQRTLDKFGMGWTGDAFSFPMVSPTQEIIGMQVRFPDGRKLTMRGSTIGLFIPRPLEIKDRILLVAEGMSDTAVCTEMGYGAIGRYNCNTCIDEVGQFINLHNELIDKVIIVSDRNQDEQRGAHQTAQEVSKYKPCIVIVPSKSKDVREAYINGMTKTIFDKIIGVSNG